MENKFTNEQIEEARACKCVEELITLAKDNEITFTEAEATNYFAQLNPENGELSDSELETVAGGCNLFEGDELITIKMAAPNCPCGNLLCFGKFEKIIEGYGAEYRGSNCGTLFSITYSEISLSGSWRHDG